MEKIVRTIWYFIVRIMEWFFRFLHIRLTDAQWKGLFQFIKFGLIGISNTALSYLVYLTTLLLLQSRGFLPRVDYLIGNIMSFFLSVLWSFYWNQRFVFRPEEGERLSWPQALLKAYISYAFTGLVLNNLILMLLVDKLGVSKLIAPFLNLLISVPLNFALNKFWAFRMKKESA